MTAQPDTKFPEHDDPEFMARLDAAVKAEQARFDAWLAESDMGAHVDCALQAGRAAFAAPETVADIPDPDDERTTWLEIDLGHRRAKPLVLALHDRNVGYVEIASWGWHINSDHVLGKRRRGQRGTARQNHAAVEAFAMALTKPGFELKITRE